MRQAIVALLAAVVLSSVAVAEDWPGWRGPTGMGQVADKGLPLTWGGKDNTNLLWKQPLLNQDKVRLDNNQSSPIVSRDAVFVTLSYWPAGVTAEKEAPEHHVLGFRKSDGKKMWDTKVPPGPWVLKDLRGGYTVPTPTTDGERVYVLFGSSVAASLDFDGKIVWRKELTPFAFDVAMGTSPVLYRDTVLLMWDQTNKTSRLIALDRKTGDVKWEQKRPSADWTHSTPVLADVKGKTQLLVAGATALQGLDPSDGSLLWSCSASEKPPPRIGDTSSPVLAGGVVYCDSGRGGPGIGVDPTGSGDVTKTHLKWKVNQVPGDSFGSTVAVGEYLYRLQNPGTVRCIQLSDGETVYTERLNGVAPAPSPFATPEGNLYFASAGKSYVVKAGPKFEVLAVNDLGDSSRSSPAVSDGRIFLRSGRFLYCVGKKE